MNVKTERAALIASAKSVALRAQSQDRNLTTSETDEIAAAVARVGELDAKSERAKEHAATLSSLTRTDGAPGSTGHLGLTGAAGKSLAASLAARMRPEGAKSLLPGGSIVGDVPMNPQPVPLGYPLTGLLNAIPSTVTAPDFAYLRQVTRTNNAAAVLPGAIKPTSVLGLTRVSQSLSVVAHLSEGIDSYDLSDNANLERFVNTEMVAGLARAVESQIISGDGTGANLTGLDNTSGVLVQAFTTSPILTARAALTTVETLHGSADGFYVVHPATWAEIETSTLTAGNYVLAEANQTVPVNSAARRLWGQSIVTSVALPVGSGYFVSAGSVALCTDGAVELRWNESGESFERNQTRCRVEGRFSLAVYQPSGVVRLDLTA